MSLAKIVQIVATSEKSFDDAVQKGVKKAAKTLRNITGVKVIDWTGKVKDGKISAYRVTMDIAFGVESA